MQAQTHTHHCTVEPRLRGNLTRVTSDIAFAARQLNNHPDSVKRLATLQRVKSTKVNVQEQIAHHLTECETCFNMGLLQ